MRVLIWLYIICMTFVCTWVWWQLMKPVQEYITNWLQSRIRAKYDAQIAHIEEATRETEGRILVQEVEIFLLEREVKRRRDEMRDE